MQCSIIHFPFVHLLMQQLYFADAYATTKLKVALSTNSPVGTPPTPSIAMYMLTGPGFGNVIVCIPVPSGACWSETSATVVPPSVAFTL